MNTMLIILPIIALVLLLVFAAVWTKDRRRTRDQSADTERLNP